MFAFAIPSGWWYCSHAFIQILVPLIALFIAPLIAASHSSCFSLHCIILTTCASILICSSSTCKAIRHHCRGGPIYLFCISPAVPLIAWIILSH
jgi:hypothetical protein